MMNKTIYTIQELSDLIIPIAKKYHLAAVYVFGSYARNEATAESDVDLLIDREDSTVSSLFDMGGLYNDCVTALNKEVDIITVQTLEQTSTKDRSPYLIENIEKEKKKIF